jgi:alpha-tubulin suppressor-like RCC1 family protein
MTTFYIFNEMLFEDYFIRKDLFTNGGLWSWGYNNYGQLGDDTITHRSSPVQTVAGGTNWKLVSCGQYHTAAIKTDGTLWGWGFNTYGQLGDNTIDNKSSPVQTVAGGTNWKSVSCGQYHIAAIKTDGTLWTWGYNQNGELGDNTRTYKSSPVQTIASGTNWKSVGCGNYHTTAIKTDGTLWSWGHNQFGQLGDNTRTAKSSPVQVGILTDWKSVSGGLYHTAAIKTDGTLWSWGYNGGGPLGDNTITNKSSPVQTIAGGTNWKSVSGGISYTAAIKTDGTLWVWGSNIYGQLGDDTRTDKSSPVQTVAGGTNWKSVDCGYWHTLAIKTDGTLWSWGNNKGQLGDNTVDAKSSPVQTVAGGTNWKLVSGGQYHTVAIYDNT